MTDLNSIDYYRSRERRELELAEAATSPAISAIHLEMAMRYADLIVNSPRRTRLLVSDDPDRRGSTGTRVTRLQVASG